MAWDLTGGANLGNATSKAASTTLILTTTAEAVAGKVIVVGIATDNIAAVDGDQGDVASVTDSAGNTYTKARQRTNSQGAAAAGACAACYFSKLATTLPLGGTITVTFNGSPVAKAMQARSLGIGAGNVVTVAGGADGSPEDGTTAPSATISGLASGEYLWVAVVAVEGPSGDTYTEDVDYGLARAGTTGGGAATNMTMARGLRVFTGTTDTHAPTLGTARDLAHVFVALEEAPLGALLEASVSGLASITIALTTAITAAAAVLGNAVTAAVLTTAIALGAASVGQASIAADLATEIRLVAPVQASAAVAADLTASQQALLQASISGSGAAIGALATEIRLAAASSGIATVVGNLTTEIRCAGALTGQASTAGILTTAIPLSASPGITGAAAGALTTEIRLAGGSSQERGGVRTGRFLGGEEKSGRVGLRPPSAGPLSLPGSRRGASR